MPGPNRLFEEGVGDVEREWFLGSRRLSGWGSWSFVEIRGFILMRLLREKLGVLLAVLLVLALSACGSSGGAGKGGGTQTTGGATHIQVSSGYPVTVTDDLGRKVTIKSRPKQIGSMAPSVTETLFAVGAGNRVVGVTTADDYPPQVRHIAKIGNYQGVNAEKVASLKTDVLFVSFATSRQDAASLQRKTGARVVVINPQSVKGAIDSIGTVGKVVGEKKKAQVVEERLRGELKQIQHKVAGKPRPTVFYEVGYNPLYTAGPGNFIDDEIRLAGGKNIAADAKSSYPQYSKEELIKKDPNYYLVGSGSGDTVAKVKKRPGYSSLKAVKEGHVYMVNDDLVSRPGPRIVEGIREIAEKIHPDAFKGK